MCWWCCMRLLEKCLPRNDIVRELAPYLQHVHQEDEENDGMLTTTVGSTTHGSNNSTAMTLDTSSALPVAPAAEPPMVRCASNPPSAPSGERQPRPTTPNDHDPACDFVSYEEKHTVARPPRPDPTTQHQRNLRPLQRQTTKDSMDDRLMLNRPKAHDDWHVNFGPPPDDVHGFLPNSRRRKAKHSTSAHSATNSPNFRSSSQMPHADSAPVAALSIKATRLFPPPECQQARTDMTMDNVGILMGAPLQKKSSAPKIKTDLGDLTTVRWEKVVIVQVSVQGFREMMNQAKDLMEDAKLLYEHTVLSRLSSEYGGQEILSQSRSGLFVIAFASEFHAAKWCLSLQLSLVYAAWNDKLLKQFDDMREMYWPADTSGKSKKNILLYRGFRVRMVIHTADSELPAEQSLSDAVQWTKTVSEYVHGGQIVLSDSVWDRLKEQLVQLGNPVVEDLGGHMVLGEEVQLMLLLPRDLEMRRFPSLKSPQQVSLGMRDAPSAFKPVTMVFTFIEGARPLVRCHAEELADRIKTLCMVARELLRKHNGYECQELQGDFMLAFFDPASAILWCGEFQLRIRQKFREWNRESENKDLMFSMSMGIETGIPASVSPHKTSGRADYFGNIVNQTARIAKAAHGGQILIGGDAWNTFASSPSDSTVVRRHEIVENVPHSTLFQFTYHGFFAFKGISAPIALIEAVPYDPLSSRGLTHTRPPKSKRIDDSQARKEKAKLSGVPKEMLRLHYSRDKEKYHDTIRETELGGISFSYGDSIVMVEDVIDSDDEDSSDEEPPPAMAQAGNAAFVMTNPCMNSSSLLQLLRNNSAGSSS